MPEAPGGFAQTYGVELLCEATPALALGELLRGLRTTCPNAEPLDRSGRSNVLAFVHPDYPVQFTDGSLPVQTFICPADKPFEVDETVEEDLRQSWSFPEAGEMLGRCRSIVLVSDLLASGLDYRTRLGLFQDALAGILTVVPALAIHWRPTGQFISARWFLDTYHEGGASRFFAGALNVRSFHLSNTSGEMLMDTLGLAALGLPDLQCHFQGLEPGRVAALLSNTAYYVFDKGDVIEDGHTIEGVAEGSRWRCQHERALVMPERVVVDLDPGPPHAAGGRSRPPEPAS